MTGVQTCALPICNGVIKPAKGLSINDTIAAEANKSIGARGVDTSQVSLGVAENDPTSRLDLTSMPPTADSDELAARAHACWIERGCPLGSPEVDWARAEQELNLRRANSKAIKAAAASL